MITPQASKVLSTRTLTKVVALQVVCLSAERIAATLLASFVGEAVPSRQTRVALQAMHARSTKALTCLGVTRQVERAEWVALALLAALTRLEIPEAFLALAALSILDVGLALTLAVR